MTTYLSALVQDEDEQQEALQIFFCHLLFNLIGIILFFPVRRLQQPLHAAKALGETVKEYKWFEILLKTQLLITDQRFGVVYIFAFFGLVPSVWIGIYFLVDSIIYNVLAVLFFFVVTVIYVINWLQSYQHGKVNRTALVSLLEPVRNIILPVSARCDDDLGLSATLAAGHAGGLITDCIQTAVCCCCSRTTSCSVAWTAARPRWPTRRRRRRRETSSTASGPARLPDTSDVQSFTS